MRVKLVLTILGVAALATSAVAQPAPWYKWRSKLNGKEFCLQTSPGDGWELASGPYKDGNCTKPGRPGS